MKFTKEQAYEELVKLMTAKGEDLNLSDRTMNSDLEILIPVLANEETELNDFVKSVLPIFKSADANIRNNVSRKLKEIQDKNPVNPPVNPSAPVSNQDSDLEQRLKALEEKYEAERKNNFMRETKDKLKHAITEKGVKNDTWIDAILSKVSISDDFNIDVEADSYVELYNKMMAGVSPNATPNSPSAGTDTHIADAIKAASDFAAQQNLLVQ